LPDLSRTEPSSRKAPSACGSSPVSSLNSRSAASMGDSSSSTNPLGIVHAPSCRLRQNGPPGWARKHSRPPELLRKRSNPALTFRRFLANFVPPDPERFFRPRAIDRLPVAWDPPTLQPGESFKKGKDDAAFRFHLLARIRANRYRGTLGAGG